MTLNACIHRGSQQVGGTCVELECGGKRILLDLGMPLDAEEGEVPLPNVPGLLDRDPTLLGVVVSHLHGDHCGLVPYAVPGLPVAMGRVAAKILKDADFFTGRSPRIEPTWSLTDRQAFDVGPFRITPYRVEHSAVDAFALQVEAAGRSLFYTGDLRGHGNDPEPLRRLLDDPPRPVHALLMEGTQVGDGREGDGPSEGDLRRVLVRRFKEWPGLVLVAWSSQNLDRLRTIHDAARLAGRALAVDLYTGTLAKAGATCDPAIPTVEGGDLNVYCRLRERLQVKEAHEFDRTAAVRRWRIFPEDLKPRAPRLVLMLRPSMVSELERAGVLDGALVIWSMWRGYLDGPSEQRMLRRLEDNGASFEVHHVSGHAYVRDLRRIVDALAPGRVVPIHSEAPARYASLFPNVEMRHDGEWWRV